MQQSREVNVNWLRINVPSIGAIVVAAITITVYINRLEGRLDVIEDSRQARSNATDKNFDQIQQQLQPLSNLPYRVGILEQGLLQTNQRVDQYLQTLGAKIDGVSDRVNGLSTKVEVLSQKIDALTPEKRAELELQRR
jgi:hypothetical protein